MKHRNKQIWLNEDQKELYLAVAKYILKGVLVGAAVAIALTSPYLVQNLLREFNRERKRKLNREDLEKVLNKFQKDRFVAIVQKGDKGYLKITQRGRRQLVEFNIDTIKIQKQKWDGRWRLVIFDIPEKSRVARDVLRQKLKEIGFILVQKSVWICPYECQNEISFISSVYEVERYVNYAIVVQIDNSMFLKEKFDLI